jgi:Ino eighty subunit 2
MDTINRLLKKQAPKRRRKADIEADRLAEEGEDPDRIFPKAYSVYMRSVQSSEGSRLGVPEEWVGAPFGPFLLQSKPVDKAAKPYSGRMVEEVS